MVKVDHSYVNYWYERAKNAEHTLRNLVRAVRNSELGDNSYEEKIVEAEALLKELP